MRAVRLMLAVGTRVSGYRIEGVVGVGRMGVVYRATQLALRRTVALRVLAPHLAADATFRRRFRRDAMLQAALEHPHVVPVYEIGTEGETLFVTTRLVSGTSLKALIAAGSLAPERAIGILAQVASALDAAHRAKLVHRGLTPENILLGEGDHAYLVDFGLAKDAGDYGLARRVSHPGSLDYLAPEQVRHRAATPKSDLYAFTAVLYEALAGEPPFAGDTDAATLYAHLSEPPPRVTARRSELPAPLDAVIAKGLAKQAKSRYGSGAKIMAAVQAALDESAAADAERRERRRSGRWRLGLLAFVSALALAGLFLGLTSPDSSALRPPFAAHAGVLGLEVPGDSQLLTGGGTLGLGLEDPVAVAWSEGDRRGDLRAGLARNAEGPLLLPPAFVRQLRERPHAERVELKNLDALRYRGLRHRRLTAPMTVFVVPTDRGAATVACLERAEAARCDAIAATLSLRGARAIEAGVTAEYRTALAAAIAHVSQVRSVRRQALARARTPGGQALAAGSLAAAFRRAGQMLAAVEPSLVERPAHRTIVRQLDDASAGYRALAKAAKRSEGLAYNRASGQARRAEEALGRALQALRGPEYQLTASR